MGSTTNNSQYLIKQGYSREYIAIRNEAETKWPVWKIESYNVNFATSLHARKLISRKS